MEERQFQVILVCLALLAVLVLVVGIVSLSADNSAGQRMSAREIVQLVGVGLLPVAAIGLFGWRRWGFLVLGLATTVALVAALPDGLFAAVWFSFLHLTTILLIAEQYYTRKEKEAEEQSAGDESH